MTLAADNLKHELIGAAIEDLDTPCLLLDWRKCQSNLERMAAFFHDRPCQLRPHFKNHKCVTLARKQLDAGSAVGITCAKLGEAEVLAEAGFENLLVANQVVGRRKVERLAGVAKHTRIAVAVDHPAQIDALSQAAQAANSEIGVMVEVDNGMGRCGVPPGEPALELAQRVVQAGGLRLDGLQSYEGHAVYIDDPAEKEAKVRQSMQVAVDTRRLIESKGIAIGAISGGSSATYRITGTIDGIDEIQAGTYATMDWRYHELAPEFEIAMTLLARVISRPAAGVAVLDFGVKAAGGEFGLPRIADAPDADVPFFKAEEHTVVEAAPDWRIGEAVRVLPSHACTTCNLHRHFFVHEDGKVADIWPIEGSGRLA